VGEPSASPSPQPSALRVRGRLWLSVAIAISVVLAVAGATTVWWLGSRTSGGPTSCSGNSTYSGTVTDSAHRGLGAIVVALSPVVQRDGIVTSVLTNDSGAWSATVSGGCGYRALLYWQSESDGPLLGNVSGLPRSSSISVNVSEAPLSLVLFREFSHTSNVTISAEISAGVRFSVSARANGNISLGFLEINAANESGTDFITREGHGTTASGSYALVYEGAKAVEVVDLDGDSVVYVLPTANGRFAFSAANDHLTMGEAIDLNLAHNVNPYVQVAGHGTATYWWDVTGGSRIPLAQNVSAFGTQLGSSFGVNAGAHAKFTVTITNLGDSDNCYVMYRESFEFHLWFYSPSHC
jgi:hypothetical protein